MSLIHNTLFIRTISNQNVKMNDAQIINKISYDRLEHILDRDDCPRKRRRLTHLSADEKLLRRKLKNRVAAQTARDRKKALMTDFEDRIMQLEEDNKSLVEENAELRLQSGILEEENNDLKQRLGLPVVDARRVKAEMECKVSAEGAHSRLGPHHASLHSLAAYDDESDYLLSLLGEIDSSRKATETKSVVQHQPGESVQTEPRLTLVGGAAAELDARDEALIPANGPASRATVEANSPTVPEKVSSDKTPYRVVIKIPSASASDGYKTVKLTGTRQKVDVSSVKTLTVNRKQKSKVVSLLRRPDTSRSLTTTGSTSRVDATDVGQPMILDFGMQMEFDDIVDVNDIVDSDFLSDIMDTSSESVDYTSDCSGVISQNDYDGDAASDDDGFVSLLRPHATPCAVDAKPDISKLQADVTESTQTICEGQVYTTSSQSVNTSFATVPSPCLSFVFSPSTDNTGSLSDSGYSGMASPTGSDMSQNYDEEMWQETLTELFPSLL